MSFLDRSELSAAATLGLTDEFLAWQGSNVGKTATLARFLSELGIWRVMASSAVAIAHTGTTAETTLVTFSVPANSLGANGALRVTCVWGYPNSANTKDCRIKYGGTVFNVIQVTTTQSLRTMCQLLNRNATNSQVGHSAGITGFGGSGSANTTAAVDTTAAQDVLITGQLGSAAETLTLHSYIIECLKKA